MLRVSVFRWIIIYHSWVHWWLPPQVGTLFLAEIVKLKCGWNLCPSHTLMTLDHGVESLTNSAVVHLTAVETAIIFKSWWLWLSEAYWERVHWCPSAVPYSYVEEMAPPCGGLYAEMVETFGVRSRTRASSACRLGGSTDMKFFKDVGFINDYPSMFSPHGLHQSIDCINLL